MPWGTAERNAEQATREYRSTLTPEQKALAANAGEARDLIRRMAIYTADPRWAHNPTTVRLISDMETELARKLCAVRLDAPAKCAP